MISDTTRETLQISKRSLDLLLFSVLSFWFSGGKFKINCCKTNLRDSGSTFVSKKAKKNTEGALGFEPRAYRTAADCSTTELYPQLMKSALHIFFFSEVTKTQRTLFTNATFCYELTILGFNYFYGLEDVQSIDFGRKIGSDRRIIFFLSFTFSSLKIQMLKEIREVSI